MVPTPRADALRDEAASVVPRLEALLAPSGVTDLAALRRTFTVQASDLVGAAPAPGLLGPAGRRAPGVSMRVLAEEWEAGPALREGRTDLEIGAIDPVDPETRVGEPATPRMAAGVRAGHPLTEKPCRRQTGHGRARGGQPPGTLHRPAGRRLG